MGGYSVESYNGDGFLKIYALPGMNLNNDWIYGNANIDFDLYQGNILYMPDNGSHWNSTPLNMRNALDELAQRVYNLEHP